MDPAVCRVPHLLKVETPKKHRLYLKRPTQTISCANCHIAYLNEGGKKVQPYHGISLLPYKAPFLLFRCLLIVKAPIPVLTFNHIVTFKISLVRGYFHDHID